MLTEPLDVGNQVPRGVGAQIGSWFAGVRPALPATALIKKHDAVPSRIEETPYLRVQRSAGSTVQKDCRFT
jgi:hypothetical protein